MESLLELSGLIGEEDEGTDLGTLERRLADKAMSNHNSSNAGTPTKSPGVPESVGNSETLEPQQDSHQHERRPSTKGSLASPKPQQRQAEKKEREGEVEALSDMMCSLVTNNVGETRYIGKRKSVDAGFSSLNMFRQVHPLDSPYSPRRVFSGSTRRLEIIPFSTE